MKLYSIFDDFGEEPLKVLRDAGIVTDVLPRGTSRPDPARMKQILEAYDGVIIGTSQRIDEEMFADICAPRIIGTASVGLDHIAIPEGKRHLVKVFNTPLANALSVAEYTFGCALACCKRLSEGRALYAQGENNKKLFGKPEELSGKTLGIVGAGNISAKIAEYGALFGMNVICWTPHPGNHAALAERGVRFADLEDLVETADVISVNIPNNAGTRNLISDRLVRRMKPSAVFISVSRRESVDVAALFDKAKANPGFYVCLDIDVDREVVDALPRRHNISVTPHIAGGTRAARKRMFMELAGKIAGYYANTCRQGAGHEL